MIPTLHDDVSRMTRQNYDEIDGAYRQVSEDYLCLLRDIDAQELWHAATAQAQLGRLASILSAYRMTHPHEHFG